MRWPLRLPNKLLSLLFSDKQSLPISKPKFVKCLNPFAPRNFAKKMCFEAKRAVFWSLSCYKELKPDKLAIKPCSGRTLRSLLIQMKNIRLRSSGMRRKLSVLLSFFAFPASFFFSFAGHLLGFILVGNFLGKLLGS